MQGKMMELLSEYNEAKSLVYGLSVSDYIALREQFLRESAVSVSVQAQQIQPVSTQQPAATAVAEPAQNVTRQPEQTKITSIPPAARKSRPAQSELDILKALGE